MENLFSKQLTGFKNYYFHLNRIFVETTCFWIKKKKEKKNENDIRLFLVRNSELDVGVIEKGDAHAQCLKWQNSTLLV